MSTSGTIKNPPHRPGFGLGGLSNQGQVLFTDKDATGGEDELLVVIMYNDVGACEKVPKKIRPCQRIFFRAVWGHSVPGNQFTPCRLVPSRVGSCRLVRARCEPRMSHERADGRADAASSRRTRSVSIAVAGFSHRTVADR
jgi:hypothetical protein